MNLRRIFLLALPVAVLAACGRQAPIGEGSGEFLGRGSLSERALAIRRAGAGLGWTMQDVAPGRFRGTLNIRSHQAVVDIPYDTQRFSIRYVTSTNLNATPGTIHPNYNGWVQNLQGAIIRESGLR
jgi:hypothetical protein